MLVIGIIGGIASGKSLVASQLRRLGAHVVDADKVGHQVLQFPHVMEALRKKWGSQVFDGDSVDRKRLAEIVFSNTTQGQEDLEYLESLTHPPIRKELIQQISRLRQQSNVPAVILDAPILFKVGWDELCDKIVFVESPIEIRQARTVELRKWKSDELAKRENRQLALNQKRARATDLIDNSSTVADCNSQVDAMWKSWGLTLPKPT